MEAQLRQGEKADSDDLPDGLDIPAELSRREERLDAIARAKAQIERRAAERYSEERAAYEKKLRDRQASVDVDTLLIVGKHLSQTPNDRQEMKRALEMLDSVPKGLGRPYALLADAGYYSDANAELCVKHKICPYISDSRDRHNKTLQIRFSEPEPLPEDADSSTRMKFSLRIPEGRALYAQRKSTWVFVVSCSEVLTRSAGSGVWSAWPGI